MAILSSVGIATISSEKMKLLRERPRNFKLVFELSFDTFSLKRNILGLMYPLQMKL